MPKFDGTIFISFRVTAPTLAEAKRIAKETFRSVKAAAKTPDKVTARADMEFPDENT